jgi:membrane associated rhomboid family serine protease
MFIPIRTEYRMAHRPWVNYALVAVNVLVYLAGFNGYNKVIGPWMLNSDDPRLVQFFTSAFLHDDFMHIAGNMLFLWVFGGPLNDRLGHVAYLAFYLAGGVLSALGYMLLGGGGRLLGASGAICAVTGAYLVMLPQVRLTVLMILYYITTFQMSSLYFVGFQFLFNVLMTATGTGGNVAVAAHSAGYVFGISVGFLLLGLKLIPRDQMDLLSMLGHARRRGRYRRMVSQGYKPFQADGPAMGRLETSRYGRWVEAKSVRSEPSDTEQAREIELRQEIAAACARHDLPVAAEKYLQLVQIAEDAVLARQAQLDVGNQLMAQEQYPAAADAYERFLRHYGAYEHTCDIHLMLGLIYGRYLHQYDRAEHYLSLAVSRLGDERKTAMAQAELDAVRLRRGT